MIVVSWLIVCSDRAEDEPGSESKTFIHPSAATWLGGMTEIVGYTTWLTQQTNK